jgi:hypothetical protein
VNINPGRGGLIQAKLDELNVLLWAKRGDNYR